jgi:hypothetical protein
LSLRLRLALFGAAVVALTLVLFGALLYALLAHSVTTNQDDALHARAGQAAAALNAAPGLAPRAPVAPVDLRTSTEIFVEVLDQSWSVIYSTGELNGAPPAIAPILRANASEVFGGLSIPRTAFACTHSRSPAATSSPDSRSAFRNRTFLASSGFW